jgi:hypothetical protein
VTKKAIGYKVGGLGANINTDEWQKKKQKLDRM